MWKTPYLLLLLCVCIRASTQINQDSGCRLGDAVVSALLDEETRTWTLTNDTLDRHDFGDIVACAEGQDRLVLPTDLVRPKDRIEISKPLTIGGAPGALASFACPENRGLFLIRGVNVTLSNVVVRDCQLSSFLSKDEAVIEAVQCSEGDSASLQLLDVVFENNIHRDGVPGLLVQDPDCYTVKMDGVVFRSNQFRNSAVLGRRNDLRNVQLIDNRGSSANVAIWSFSDANTVIENLVAKGNAMGIVRSKGGTLTVASSNFTDNRATSPIVAEGTVVMVRSSRFLNNACDGTCASLYVTGGSVDCRSSRFVKNTADQGAGGIYSESSVSLSLNDLYFDGNRVLESGGGSLPYAGALYALGHRTARDTRSLQISNTVFYNNAGEGIGAAAIHVWTGNVSIQASEFLDNEGQAEDSGGALSISRGRDIDCIVQNCTFRSNGGYKGGGMHVQESSGSLVVRRSAFTSNIVWEGDESEGGAFALDSFGEIKAQFDDVVFAENRGGVGGAFYGHNRGSDITFRNCRFRKNFAKDGGAVHLHLVNALTVEGCVFENNEAENQGGAVKVSNPWSAIAFSSTTFGGNVANSGGGVHARGDSETAWNDCRFESNTAKDQGGAVDLEGRKAQFVSTMFLRNTAPHGGGLFASVSDGQCDLRDVRFVSNEATLGGGALFRVAAQKLQGTVVMRDTRFEDNVATGAGGGVFVDDASALDVSCKLAPKDPQGGSGGYLQSNIDCPFMEDNKVGRDGYGPAIATAANDSVAMLDFRDNSTEQLKVGEVHLVSQWPSGNPLPDIHVALVDQFLQGPAVPTRRGTSNAVADRRMVNVKSPDGFISNQIISNISNGTTKIPIGSPLKLPGNYTLLVWIGDDIEQNMTIKVNCRECIVGEVTKKGRLLCDACGENHYSVDPNSGSCLECPKDAVCDQWGLKPKKDHWMPSPCYPKIMECLSNDACKGDSDEKLTAFLAAHTPSCSFTSSDNQPFLDMQCNEGYEGPLCGSCKDGFGQFELRCFKCESKIIIVLWLIWNTAWTFFTSAISVLGNLHDTGAFESADTVDPESSTRAVMLDRDRPDEDVAIVPVGSYPPTDSVEQRREVAKRNVTEAVKLFLNFAQVNSMAVGINNEWTSMVDKVLRMLNFVGAASLETTLSLDCLFSKSSSAPRSVLRTVISLLLPFVVLIIGAVVWKVLIINDPPRLRRRWILTTVVVLYISYIGWVQKLAAAMNCLRIPMGIKEEQSSRLLYWTEDTSVQCFMESHGIVIFTLVIPMILLVVVAFPIGSAYYLFRKRHENRLETVSVKEKFGFMYAAYTKDCVYWDCLILLRKAALAVVIVFGASLGSNMQGLVSVCILILALYLNMKYLPYNCDFLTFNAGEIFSLLVSISTFVGGLFMNDPSNSEIGRNIVSVIVVVLISSFVVYFLYDLCMKIGNFCRVSLEMDGIQLDEEDSGIGAVGKWMLHKSKNMRMRLARTFTGRTTD